MYRRLSTGLTIALLIGVFISVPLARVSPAQPTSKSQKRERFGSSLKRLKWNQEKQAAVETKQNKADKSTGQSNEDTIRLETLFVSLDVLVSDRAGSRFVTGLGKDDFTVTEDGHPQQVSTFALGDDRKLPRMIVLILDYSGSQLPYLRASINAARMFVGQLAPADEMAIVTDDIELLVDFTRDRARLNAALDALEKRMLKKRGEDLFGRALPVRRGQSLQFSALFAALRELVNRDARQVVIFQTDGDEATTLRDQPEASDYVWNRPRREYGLADIYAAAEKSRATIYTVVPSERLAGLPPSELYGRGRQVLETMERARFETDEEYQRYAAIFPLSDAKVKLFTDRFVRGQQAASRVAELTGGWTAFLEKPEQAAGVYSRILSDINHRYIIGYYPTNTDRSGKLRRVRVEVRGHPEYKVHHRTSYSFKQ